MLQRLLGLTDDDFADFQQRSREAIDAAKNFASELFATQVADADRDIALQRTRVEEASALAERGRIDLVDQEERRLNDLLEIRERAVARQRTLANIELAINQALAISNTVRGLTGAIAQPFPANLVAVPLVLALAAQVGSGVLAVSNALSGIQGFEKGIEDTNKASGPAANDGKNGFLAVLHKGKNGKRGERVLTSQVNDALDGFPSERLPEAVAHFLSDTEPMTRIAHIPMPMIEQRLYRVESQTNEGLKQMAKAIDRLEKRMDNSNGRVQVLASYDSNGHALHVKEIIDGLQVTKKIIG